MSLKEPLRQIFEMTRFQWDQPFERWAVRRALARACLCKTAALGGEVYSSGMEEKIIPHTCKSKACPSCGNRATLDWQAQQRALLPDTPYVGIVLTMPDVFWPIFENNRGLQNDLPAIGANALSEWAWSRYRVKLGILVIQHTFGGYLNYVPHLHMMLSAGGLKPATARWVAALEFDRVGIMKAWRFAVTSYLRDAYKSRLVYHSQSPEEVDQVIGAQERRPWNVKITRSMPKWLFLKYAGRYVRRMPIAQRRILSLNENQVVFQSKDTRKSKQAGTTVWTTRRCSPRDFMVMLTRHMWGHYRHAMRYFGLLAPRAKGQSSSILWSILGQRRRQGPPRQPFAQLMKKEFGHNPLVDSSGNQMRWIRSVRSID